MKKIILSAAFIAVSVTTFAQVGIGTTSPNTNAALDITSTTQGFLPPRMTRAQMNAIAAPPEGLMVYCLDCSPKGIYVNNGSSGSSEFINMITGESTNTDTTTAVVELISATGRVWMDRNLGATQAATSLTDATAYGDLYQWGRVKDGHQSRTSSGTSETVTTGDPGHGDFILGGSWTTTPPNALWPTGLNDPCPTGYRIPTETEFQTEIDNFTTKNSDGAFEALKFTAGGFRYDSNEITLPGQGGYYWSSTARDSNAASSFGTDPAAAYINAPSRGLGMSIRCIKEFVNESVTDTDTERNDITSAATGRIWMDRNLGATQAAGSLTDAAAYGDLYQWGRAKDGHQIRTSSTTTTTATSANAGHGNFIIADTPTDKNWTDFAAEDALWPTGVNDPCPTGYRIPTGPELEAERIEFTSNDATGAYSALQLPLSGYRGTDGVLSNVGTKGYLWSSTAVGPNYLGFNNDNTVSDNRAYVRDNSSVRATALPIRCIKEE